MTVNVQVVVTHNDMGRALRRLRKKFQVEGIGYDMRRTDYYLSPAQKRVAKRRRAATRARKKAKAMEGPR